MNDHTNHRSTSIPVQDSGWLSFALAFGMHLILAAVLFFSLKWNTQPAAPTQVELWAALPVPNAINSPTPKPVVKEPPPQSTAPVTNPDIALEIERQRLIQQRQSEQAALREQQMQEKKRQERQQRILEENKLQVQRLKEQERQQEQIKLAQQQEKLKDTMRREALQAAGLTANPLSHKNTSSSQGTANAATGSQGNGDPNALARYGDLIKACIRPGVIYNPPSDLGGNPNVEFQVKLLPSGEVSGVPKLIKSSGISAFDAAVENGIRRCTPFPRPPSGKFESSLIVSYSLLD